MSPGVTFERVYNELKRLLTGGELSPGAPIEPAVIGKQIASSITPVRDALHRLTGERLVEAPHHNGFRVPLITEAGLRDLYNWHAQLLILAARHARSSTLGESETLLEARQDPAEAMASLFTEIVMSSGNMEHVLAVQLLNDRLAAFRRLEPEVLSDFAGELDLLTDHHRSGGSAMLVSALEKYRRRRVRAASALLAARHGRKLI